MAETIDVKKLLEIFSDEKSGEILTDFQLPIRWDGGDFYQALYFRLKKYQSRIEWRYNCNPGSNCTDSRDYFHYCQRILFSTNILCGEKG